MLSFNNAFGVGRPTVIVNNVLFVLGWGFLAIAAITALGAIGDAIEHVIRYVVGF